METQYPMIVKFIAKKDSIELVKTELIKILEPTRSEIGCIKYDLHQDLDDPSVFMFYEIWATKEAWIAHDSTPHINAFRKAIEGMVHSIDFNKLTLL